MIALITFLAQPSPRTSLTGTQPNTNPTLIKKISATTFDRSASSAARGPQTPSLLWRSAHTTSDPKLATNCPCNIKIDWCMDQNGLTGSQIFPPFSSATTGGAQENKQVAFNTNRWEKGMDRWGEDAQPQPRYHRQTAVVCVCARACACVWVSRRDWEALFNR